LRPILAACSIALAATALDTAAPLSAANDTAWATGNAKTVYNWYFALPNRVDPLSRVGDVRAQLDPQFYEMLRDSRTQPRCCITDDPSFKAAAEQPGYDVDLFTGSQGGAVRYSLGTPKAQSGGVRVPVLLISAIGNQPFTVTADVRRNTSGAPILYDVVYARDGSARGNLTKFLNLTGANAAASLVVENYYALWNAKDYAAMYALLSKRFQASHPYAAYPKAHSFADRLVLITTPGSTASTVPIRLLSNDHDEHGHTSTTTFKGTWYLVQENGSWKLDNQELNETH
jgi:hypothetical protein